MCAIQYIYIYIYTNILADHINWIGIYSHWFLEFKSPLSLADKDSTSWLVQMETNKQTNKHIHRFINIPHLIILPHRTLHLNIYIYIRAVRKYGCR
jgi:hypothetical protein